MTAWNYGNKEAVFILWQKCDVKQVERGISPAGEEELRRDGLRNGSSSGEAWELQSTLGDLIAKDILSVGTSSIVSNQGIALTPSLNNPNVLQSIFGLRIKDLGGRGDDLEKMCNGRQAMVLHKELSTLSRYEYGPLSFDLNAAISEIVTTPRPVMTEADTGLSFLDTTMDKPILWMKTIGEDSCVLSAAPLVVKYDEMSTTNFLKDDNNTNMPSIGNGINIGHTVGPEETEVAIEVNYCQYEGTSTTVSLSVEPIIAVKHLTMSLEKPTFTDEIVSKVGIQSNSESKLLPNFESFVIEEEEGSGDCGTVYRVRRKEDGKIFAVKCPHPNTRSHHVHNEMKMLERFGGRNFVIKYEGSLKNGRLECFVLEHVEHDRPEVIIRFLYASKYIISSVLELLLRF